MIYGVFRDSEFLWNDSEQKLYRKLIEPDSNNHFYNHEEFIEVNCKPTKSIPYIRFTINNKSYLLHRLVYLLYNPDFDIHDSSRNNSIDHRDENKLNNSIENLNLVNNKQNSQNKKKVKGFSIYKNSIQAHYSDKDGKKISKSFSIKKYGYEKALQLAQEYRKLNTTHYYKG